MLRDLDITHLRSIVAIADTGGFGRAATTLHVSQSTVSQHVRLLEKAIGRPVVERQGRGTRFTADGERLLGESRRILAVHDEALARLDASASAPVLVGASETAAEQVLPALLSGLRASFPERHVQFLIDRSAHIADAVDRGAVDVAVVLGFPGAVPGREAGTLELAWYASPDWKGPEAGSPFPLVTYTAPCGIRQRALGRLGEAGIAVEVAAEATSLEGVLAATRARLGASVLPSAGAAPAGLVRRDDLPHLGRIGVYLAARHGAEAAVESRASGALETFLASLA